MLITIACAGIIEITNMFFVVCNHHRFNVIDTQDERLQSTLQLSHSYMRITIAINVADQGCP